eukprot:Partr_v1_DN28712_c3_g1_i1_m62934 putative Inherit from COG: epimerase dehydratase
MQKKREMPMGSTGKKTVLVTSATGNTGFSAVKCMIQNKDLNVRACTWTKSKQRDLLDKLPGLNKVCQVDANEPGDQLKKAFRGVDYVFLVPDNSKDRVQHVKNYVDMCQEHRVKHIVLFSMLRPKDCESDYKDDYEEMESLVEYSGIAYTIIQSVLQMQTLFLLQEDILRHFLPLPMGGSKFAPVNGIDISRMVSAIFSNPSKHASAWYHVVGPDLLTGQQIAECASNCLNMQIQYLNISFNNFKSLLQESGVESWLAAEFVEIFDEIRNGKFDSPSKSSVPAFVSGCKQLTICDFFCVHGERFKKSRGIRPVDDLPEGVNYEKYPCKKARELEKEGMDVAGVSRDGEQDQGERAGKEKEMELEEEMKCVLEDLKSLTSKCYRIQREIERRMQKENMQ